MKISTGRKGNDILMMKDARKGKDIILTEKMRRNGTFILGMAGEEVRTMITQDIKSLKEGSGCGITLIAPHNADFPYIIETAGREGLNVNILDPMSIYDDENVNNCILNPMYVPKGLTRDMRKQRIMYNMTNILKLSDKVVELCNMDADRYLMDVYHEALGNIAILCMFNASLNERTAHLGEVLEYLYYPQKIKSLYDDTCRILGTTVIKDETGEYRVEPANGMATDKNELLNEARAYESQLVYASSALDIEAAGTLFYNLRGLRVILNRMLLDKRVKGILCGREEMNSKDLELTGNEITLINTAAEIGEAEEVIIESLALKMLDEMFSFGGDIKHSTYIKEAMRHENIIYNKMGLIFKGKGMFTFTKATLPLSEDKTEHAMFIRETLKLLETHIILGRITRDEIMDYETLGWQPTYDWEYEDNIMDEPEKKANLIRTKEGVVVDARTVLIRRNHVR